MCAAQGIRSIKNMYNLPHTAASKVLSSKKFSQTAEFYEQRRSGNLEKALSLYRRREPPSIFSCSSAAPIIFPKRRQTPLPFKESHFSPLKR
jgi:hypothetical protein